MKKTNLSEILEKYYDKIARKTRESCEADRKNVDTRLQSFDAYCEKKQHEAVAIGKEMVNACQKAIVLIIEEFEARKDEKGIKEFRQKISRFASHLAKEDEEEQEREFEGKIINDLVKLSPELMEKIFQAGAHYLRIERYEDAAKVFVFLNFLDPGYSACWLSLGIALKMLKRWAQSLSALNIAIKMDPHHPLPHYHAAFCYKELGLNKEAQDELKLAQKEAHKRHNGELEKTIAYEQSHIP